VFDAASVECDLNLNVFLLPVVEVYEKANQYTTATDDKQDDLRVKNALQPHRVMSRA